MSEQEQLEQTKRILAWHKLQQQIFGKKIQILKSKKVKNEKVG